MTLPENLSVPIISVIVGAAILLFGRKLFWLFVAALGFAVGLEIAAYFMHEPPVWMTLVIALGLGVLGALLAILLQKLAIAVAGFIAGGRLASALAGGILRRLLALPRNHFRHRRNPGRAAAAGLVRLGADSSLLRGRRAPDQQRDCAAANRRDDPVLRSRRHRRDRAGIDAAPIAKTGRLAVDRALCRAMLLSRLRRHYFGIERRSATRSTFAVKESGASQMHPLFGRAPDAEKLEG